MIRSLYYTQDGHIHTDLAVEDFQSALQDAHSLLWVDFQGNPPEEDEPILRNIFGFHPLAIDDALQESHVPKLDDWGNYLYVVLHSVNFNVKESDRVETLELDIFLGGNYMITHHDQSIQAVDRVWSLVQRDERHLKNGADHLFYRLADEVVASYMPVIEKLDEEIDTVENRVFEKADPQTVEIIFMLKRAVLRLRRVIGPQREVLNKLARDDFAVIDPQAQVYFRDVYDHLVRLYDLSENIRDLVGGSLDIYLSVINNRMNDIMKTLTVITVLFAPLTFITGFFGMNFFAASITFQTWTHRPAFILAILFMVVVPAGMFLWVRRRGWMK